MGVLSADAAPLIRKEAASYSALLIGPGWGREKTTRDLLAQLLDGDARTRPRAAPSASAPAPPKREDEPNPPKLPPLVIDADGLNLLARD